ncbi:MAG: hypothetical protein PHF29_01495 [Candidatus Riflebacteria bacterium]|nr:hypothetical protein [Candidatus Riflebacteria bacterium]
MKKGCLGCFGGGCVVFIILLVVAGYLTYGFLQTQGREMLANGIDATIESISEKGISNEVVRKEVLTSAKALTDKIRNQEIGFIDLSVNISKTFNQDFYAKYSLVGLYKQSTASGTQISPEEQNSIKKVVSALYAKKITHTQLASFTAILQEASQELRDKTPPEQESEDIKNGDGVKILLGYGGDMASEISAGNLKRAISAITKIADENSLDETDENFNTDSLVKNDILEIIRKFSEKAKLTESNE